MSSTLKIASWNINSIRARIGIVEKFLTEAAPDILCLQETKVRDAEFPHALFHRLGYKHLFICGQPMHHGVAIASRVKLREDHRHDWQDNGEARHIGVLLESGVRLENVYVPAGGDIPDREVNSKFGQKLDFVGRMTRWSETVDRPTIMVGDFNIAPLECDVWSHRQLINVVRPHPGRGGGADPAADEQRLGRSRPPLLSRAAAAAHLVELPLARLDEERPGPPARPYVGHRRRGQAGRAPHGP